MTTTPTTPGSPRGTTHDEAPARVDSLRRLEQEVSVLIRRVKRVVGDRARAVHPELHPSTYLVLSFLDKNGPMRATALAESFALDKGALSRQIAHLVSLGLVESEPDPDDRRAQLLGVTEDGAARMSDVDTHRRTLLDERLHDWSAADLADFVDLLGRYNASLTDLG